MSGRGRRGAMPTDAPKDEVWVGHEIRYTLQHTPRLQNKRRESDFVQVHADSGSIERDGSSEKL